MSGQFDWCCIQANAVIQALYSCEPFRNAVLKWELESKAEARSDRESMLMALATLFVRSSIPFLFDPFFCSPQKRISTMSQTIAVVEPEQFITRLKVLNEAFRNLDHQDAQEFFSFLLNQISEDDVKMQQKRRVILQQQQADLNLALSVQQEINGQPPPVVAAAPPAITSLSTGPRSPFTPLPPQITAAAVSSPVQKIDLPVIAPSSSAPPLSSFVDFLFRGELVNETKCLRCGEHSLKKVCALTLSVL